MPAQPCSGRYGASPSMSPTNSGRSACPSICRIADVLAGVIPVMVEHPLQERAEDARALGWPSMTTGCCRVALVDRVQPWVCGGLVIAFPRPPTPQRGAGCRRARRRRTISLTCGSSSVALGAPQPVTLFLPGQMADVPTDAVHRQDSGAGRPHRSVRRAHAETQLRAKRNWTTNGCSMIHLRNV